MKQKMGSGLALIIVTKSSRQHLPILKFEPGNDPIGAVNDMSKITKSIISLRGSMMYEFTRAKLRF